MVDGQAANTVPNPGGVIFGATDILSEEFNGLSLKIVRLEIWGSWYWDSYGLMLLEAII